MPSTIMLFLGLVMSSAKVAMHQVALLSVSKCLVSLCYCVQPFISETMMFARWLYCNQW